MAPHAAPRARSTSGCSAATLRPSRSVRRNSPFCATATRSVIGLRFASLAQGSESWVKEREMADKTLRITFSGISTLLPGTPGKNGEPPEQAFVMMAANSETASSWGVTIPEHFPFVHVASSLLVDPPDPDEIVAVSEGGERSIY